MECTQRLECTQDLYDTHTEKVCPEQIGFLGICGAKHPILKGPNKIGRDPQTCSIVLNVNSVSRQHAVINILSKKEFMLMDLDSANKTKLLNKTLQAYIPHPLKDGDTVQFGDIFGIFRLLEENDELPMTQAIDLPMTQAIDLPMTQPVDIPETPMPRKCVSKLKGLTTLIPESPDVSDKDDSFTTPVHQKHDKSRLSNGNFINSFGKSIPIHPVSTKKDTSLNSSKTSILVIDQLDVGETLEDSKNVSGNVDESHAQVPYRKANITTANGSIDSIYMADTQIPPGHYPSPSIHNMDTQVPPEHLPEVCKVGDQRKTHVDICLANKENELSIFNADTQPVEGLNDNKMDAKCKGVKKINGSNPKTEQTLNKSDDELLFDEIEDECLEEFYSQTLLPQESSLQNLKSTKLSKENTSLESDTAIDCDDLQILATQKLEELTMKEPIITTVDEKIVHPVAVKRNTRIKSDSSTDCEDIEDIIVTQKIPELPVRNHFIIKKSEKEAALRDNRVKSDSSTDCEDIDIIPTQKVQELKVNDVDKSFVGKLNSPKDDGRDGMDFEDMPTQVIDLDPDKDNKSAFEDMNTQIVAIDIVNNDIKSDKDISFADQPTQLIEAITPNTSKEKSTLNEDISSPFKIPLQTPIRVKTKETFKDKNLDHRPIDPGNYYSATQDILEDLCTQRDEISSLKELPDKSKRQSPIIIDDDIVPCSVEDYETGAKFSNIDKDLSPIKRLGQKNTKVSEAGLSRQQVRDIIGIIDVSKSSKNPSDSSSDVETTPKKVKACMFTDSDLPNSQEIEISRLVHCTKHQENESLSESESEENSEEQHTPFLHRKKKAKPVAKIDLTKKFDVEKLPERIITRIRKPTAKMEENLQSDKKSSNILKGKFLSEQEDQINEDIIKENVKRLKTYERKRNKEAKNDLKHEGDKSVNQVSDKIEIKNQVKDERTQPQTEKNNEPKEKIKVKIQKSKKKEICKTLIDHKESTANKNSENSLTNKSKEESCTKKNVDNNLAKEDSNHSKSDEKFNTRSTRTRKKDKNLKSLDKKDVSPEDKERQSADNKRTRPTRKRVQPKISVSPEVEIRRSKRQGNLKENKSDVQITQPKSILKKNIHEQSTVYNVSSSSGESPKNLKRPLDDENDVPCSKRTRSVVNNENSGISNASLRATPARTMKNQYVLFTAFPSEEVKQKLEKLGAVIVTDIMKCTVVLTMQIKRTFKLLCAVGLGRPIVGPSWVQACADTRMIVDPWLYLIKDEQAEKRFQFTLDRTLNGKRNFLKGYNVSSTPSVQPNSSEMKLIVECSGGTWKEGGSNWICVSCTKDQACWPALRKRGAIVVSTEFILGGVLKQKIDINSNKFV